MNKLPPYSDEQVANALAIAAFFEAMGGSPVACVALVVNGDRECSLLPKAIGDHDQAFGLYQWHLSRILPIIAACGADPRDGTLQSSLEAAKCEFLGAYAANWKEINSYTTVAGAALAACVHYERAGAANAIARSNQLSAIWAPFFAEQTGEAIA